MKASACQSRLPLYHIGRSNSNQGLVQMPELDVAWMCLWNYAHKLGAASSLGSALDDFLQPFIHHYQNLVDLLRQMKSALRLQEVRRCNIMLLTDRLVLPKNLCIPF